MERIIKASRVSIIDPKVSLNAGIVENGLDLADEALESDAIGKKEDIDIVEETAGEEPETNCWEWGFDGLEG